MIIDRPAAPPVAPSHNRWPGKCPDAFADGQRVVSFSCMKPLTFLQENIRKHAHTQTHVFMHEVHVQRPAGFPSACKTIDRTWWNTMPMWNLFDLKTCEQAEDREPWSKFFLHLNKVIKQNIQWEFGHPYNEFPIVGGSPRPIKVFEYGSLVYKPLKNILQDWLETAWISIFFAFAIRDTPGFSLNLIGFKLCELGKRSACELGRAVDPRIDRTICCSHCSQPIVRIGQSKHSRCIGSY